MPPPTVDCLSSRFHQLLRQSAMPEPPPPEAFSHAPSSLAPLTIYENRRVHNCERTLGEVLRCALASVVSMDALRHARAAATGHRSFTRQYPSVGTHMNPVYLRSICAWVRGQSDSVDRSMRIHVKPGAAALPSGEPGLCAGAAACRRWG